MQTFLPYKDFGACARCLDYKRLGKQRIEARMIYDIVTGRKSHSRWRNHPAVRMWRNNIDDLAEYHDSMIAEWINRGYKNNMEFLIAGCLCRRPRPKWLTDYLCCTHRSNLIRKKPEYYGPMWPDMPDNLPYLWPK